MVDRPYHDYSTVTLRELSRDLAASQAQLEDQRADCLERVGADGGDLRQVDVLINNLGRQLAIVDQELATRERERAAAAAGGHRAVTQGPERVRRYGSRVTLANPKPHCRPKHVNA
jgi:hypothetical protein